MKTPFLLIIVLLFGADMGSLMEFEQSIPVTSNIRIVFLLE